MSGMNEQVEQMKQFVSNLEDLTECPVCFGSMDSTLKQCLNGHGICSSCASKVDNCPSCKEKIIVQKSTLLGQILERLPKICSYAKNGCNTFVFDKSHEVFCEFRRFSCLNKACRWRGCVKDLLQHVQECYFDYEICLIPFLDTKQQKRLTINVNAIDDEPVISPIIFQNQLFYSCIFLNTDLKPGKIVMLYRFYHVPTSKPTCKYYFIARFLKDRLRFKLTYCAKSVIDHSQIKATLSGDGIDDIDGILVMSASDLRRYTIDNLNDGPSDHSLELGRELIDGNCHEE